MAIRKGAVCQGLITGTTGNLKSIYSTNLTDESFAITVDSGKIYFHGYNITSTTAESSPEVIRPIDLGAGDPGRWFLLDVWTGLAALDSIGALTPAADKMSYFTAAATAALADLTASARTLLALDIVAGDTFYGSDTAVVSKLAKGTARQGLVMNDTGTVPTWAPSVRSVLTAQGDIVYASAANTLARLAAGDAYKTLRMNAAGTAPEWAFSDASSVLDGTITQAKLKTSGGEVSTTLTANLTLPGGDYGFFPKIKVSAGSDTWTYRIATGFTGTSYVTNIAMVDDGSPDRTAYAYQTYVTSSGEVHWIFILVDKATGKKLSFYSAPDHPSFGNKGLKHPFPDYKPELHEILVVNPSRSIVKEIELLSSNEDYDKPDRGFLETFNELYEVQEGEQADWPEEPITVGLPKVYKGSPVDWRFIPQGTFISPIKRTLKKPDFITPLKIKRINAVLKKEEVK